MSDAVVTPTHNVLAPITGLSWSIKRTFTNYVDGIPDGRRSADAGARRTPDGKFAFDPDPFSTFDRRTSQRTIKFLGDVRYLAHYGMLFVMVADPWVQFDGPDITLSVRVMPDSDERVVIAKLEVTESAPAHTYTASAQLTADGAQLFNDVYRLGDPLDPLTFTVPS